MKDYTQAESWRDWTGYTVEDRETFAAAYAALEKELLAVGLPINPVAIRNAISKAHFHGTTLGDLLRVARPLLGLPQPDDTDIYETDTSAPTGP